MFPQHRSNGAYLLAMASAGSPIVGLRFEDVKWLISVAASLIGAVVALWIHERGLIKAAEAEERRRQELLDWEQRLKMRETELCQWPDVVRNAAAIVPPFPPAEASCEVQ